MKFNKISIMALAMAGVLVGCSDEQDFKYTEGAQSPGAYFATNSAKVVEVEDDATEVGVTVRRINTSTTTTAISVSGDTELFTFPATVNFSGDALETQLMIGYKAADLEYDKKYNVEITLADASNYGMATYKFAIVRPAPIAKEVLHEYMGPGEGATYIYNAFITGYEPDLGIEISYNTMTPDQKTYTFFPWGMWEEDDASDAQSLKLLVDMSKPLPALPQIDRPEGCYGVIVPQQYIGYTDDDGYKVYIECYHTFYGLRFPDEYDNSSYGFSFYNPETGQFTLDVIYTVPDYGTGNSYYADGTEYCQLPGYPDYSIDMVYEGFMTAADGRQSYALVEVTTGADFDEVRLVNIEGDDADTAIQAVMDGGMEYETMGPSETKSLRFPIEGSGEYTTVAIGIKSKENVRTATVSYTIAGGGIVENKDWVSKGMAEYIDGWVMPGFQYNDGTSVNPYDNPYYIEIKEHKDHPGLYKMVAPYSQANSPVGELNEETGLYDIIFNAEDPGFVYMEPQYCGFDFGEENGASGKMTIYDITGMYIANGWTKEEVLERFNSKQDYREEWSKDDDGVITFTPCIFDAFGGEGYSWKVKYPAELWMPGTYTPQNAAIRHIRRAANQPLQLTRHNDAVELFKQGKLQRPLRIKQSNSPFER